MTPPAQSATYSTPQPTAVIDGHSPWCCDCAALSDATAADTAVFTEGELTQEQAHLLLANAPAYVQDICALARAYATCAHARTTFCYTRMRHLWDVSNASRLHTSYPRSLTKKVGTQRLLQCSILLIERADIAGAPKAHFPAVRAAGVFIAALLLSTISVRIRLDALSVASLRDAATLSADVSLAVRAIQAGAVLVAAPRHGAAYAPDNIVHAPLHPAARRTLAPPGALGYQLAEEDVMVLRMEVLRDMDEAARVARAQIQREAGPREELRKLVANKKREVAMAQRALQEQEITRLSKDANAKLALFAEAQAEVKRVSLRLQQLEK